MNLPRRYHPLLVTLHWLVAVLVGLNLYAGLTVFLPHGHTDPAIAIHMAAGLAVLVLVSVRFIVRIKAARPPEAESGSVAVDLLAQAVQYALYFMLISTTIIGLVFAVRTNHFQEAFLGAEEPAAGAPTDHLHPPEAITPLPTLTPEPTATGAAPEADEYGEYYGRDTEGQAVAVPTPDEMHMRMKMPPSPAESAPPVDRAGFFLQGLHLLSARILLTLIAMHVLAAIYHQFVRRDNLLSRMGYGPRQ